MGASVKLVESRCRARSKAKPPPKARSKHLRLCSTGREEAEEGEWHLSFFFPGVDVSGPPDKSEMLPVFAAWHGFGWASALNCALEKSVSIP